jgi:hypothetical protein
MAAGTMIAIDFSSDATQSAACVWREQNVYPKLVQGGVLAGPVKVLSGNNANGAALNNALNQGNVVYLTGVAHGASDAFPDSSGEAVLSTTTYNPPQVNGKIIHLVACNTAGSLGRTLADSGGGGAAAFFGYSNLFQWPVGVPSGVTDIFFNCDAQIDFALAAGKTAGEAYNLTVQAYQLGQAQLLANYPDIGAQMAAHLEQNLSCLCGPRTDNDPYGCASAKLGQPCSPPAP